MEIMINRMVNIMRSGRVQGGGGGGGVLLPFCRNEKSGDYFKNVLFLCLQQVLLLLMIEVAAVFHTS